MKSSKNVPKILVVNDDGISSPGLRALAQAMKSLGDVWVVAPERPQNAAGRALTLHKPLRLHRIKKQMFAVNGTPADCVTLGVGFLLKKDSPALVISGINMGLNLGDDVTTSGTVSAAIEGVLRGVPSIAISLEGQRSFSFQASAKVAQHVAAQVLKFGLASETLLNVNVPQGGLKEMKGLALTSLCRRNYQDPVIEKVDPRGRHYYWIAGEQTSWGREKGSDVEAISNKKVSMTPLHIDLTKYQALKSLRSWESSLTKQIRRS